VYSEGFCLNGATYIFLDYKPHAGAHALSIICLLITLRLFLLLPAIIFRSVISGVVLLFYVLFRVQYTYCRQAQLDLSS
ncbi:hypothetical protein PLICRDRAFT_95787, partial [Plicaturopsis crispa FD-325 SS-3]